VSAARHPLLERQLRRAFGDGAPPAGLDALLEAVSQAYEDADGGRMLVERALDMMSRELNERNEQLSAELRERQLARDELQRRSEEQQVLIRRLEEAHDQLLQSEKLAAIGQLAAGVAHEINNPIAFVSSNLDTLRDYAGALLNIVAAYEAREPELDAAARAALRSLKDDMDYGFMREDLARLVDESRDGALRVKRIVQDLKDFAHVGEQGWTWAQLHDGLESTLNIVNNEIKYVAAVTRRYGDLPLVECLPSQLNQVFMNMLVNAAHALGGARATPGRITVTTGCDGADGVFIEIADNGCGIAPDNMKRIFDPFFTTKPVGKGTGLGLSLSYGIVHKHGGHIAVSSEPGAGTRFRVCLPVRQRGEPEREAVGGRVQAA